MEKELDITSVQVDFSKLTQHEKESCINIVKGLGFSVDLVTDMDLFFRANKYSKVSFGMYREIEGFTTITYNEFRNAFNSKQMLGTIILNYIKSRKESLANLNFKDYPDIVYKDTSLLIYSQIEELIKTHGQGK